MGMSLITAMEIFTNAKDLDFVIGEKDGKFAIAISRGPGHRFKLLVSGKPVIPSKKEAVDAVRDLLTAICEVGEKEFLSPESLIRQVANPDNVPIEDADNTLKQEAIEKICLALTSTGRAQTY